MDSFFAKKTLLTHEPPKTASGCVLGITQNIPTAPSSRQKPKSITRNRLGGLRPITTYLFTNNHSVSEAGYIGWMLLRSQHTCSCDISYLALAGLYESGSSSEPPVISSPLSPYTQYITCSIVSLIFLILDLCWSLPSEGICVYVL